MIAIDIVLVPPPELMDICLNESTQLAENRTIPLDLNNCVPHLTLGMGVIAESCLEQVKANIKSYCFDQYELKVTNEYQANLDDGRRVCGIGFGKSVEIHELAKTAMSWLKPYEESRFDSACLFQTDNIDIITLDFIRNFKTNSGGEAFHPHVTIGFGRLDISPYLGKSFKFRDLALFQLGNYCTCRKRLV